MSVIIAPSILAADFCNLQRDCELVNNSKADWFHLDIMDGVFVPNISFGTPIMKVLKENAKKTLDVHLMIVNPEKYIEKFAELGSTFLTVHYEACINNMDAVIESIKKNGMKAGIAINPDTDWEVVKPYMNVLDLILVMSVHPGFGGQKFISSAIDKLKSLRKEIDQSGREIELEVDGGTQTGDGLGALININTLFSNLEEYMCDGTKIMSLGWHIDNSGANSNTPIATDFYRGIGWFDNEYLNFLIDQFQRFHQLTSHCDQK